MRRTLLLSAFLPLLLSPASGSDAGAAIEIAGRVTIQGSGVPEARAVLLPVAALAVQADDSAAIPVGETHTDARGRFRLRAPEAGMWTVRIEAAGRPPVDVAPVPLLESIELPTVELDGGGETRRRDRRIPERRAAVPETPAVVALTGRVVEHGTGRPIPRALVWPAENPAGFVRTDSAGAFEVAVPRGGGELEAAAAGFRRGAPVAVPPVDPAAAPTLELRPAAVLSGRIVDRDNRPLGAADVRAADAYTRSADDGLFTISGLPATAELQLVVTHRGFSAATLDVEPLAPFERRGGLRVALERGRTGFGFVVDGEERPVSSATVRLERDRAAQTRPATTGADGRFEVPGLEPGRYRLEVEARGFAPAAVPGLEVDDGETPLDLGVVVLVPGSGIAGRVFETRGEPIADVEVHLAKAGTLAPAGAPVEPPHTVTDAAGRFEIADLQPGEPVGLTFRKSGYLTEHLAAVRVPASDPLDVLLLRAAKISGLVLGEDGEPIAGARVDAAAGADRLRRSARRTTTGADGRFELEGVALGRLTLTADAEGYLPYRTADLQVTEGQTNDGLEILLERGATLAGRVSAGDGRAVADAALSAYPAGERGGFARRDTLSEGDGRYRIDGVVTGPLRVVAEHPDFVRAAKEIVVEPGMNRLDVELESGSEISGWIVETTGDPVSDALVTLEDPAARFGGEPPRATSAADGAFALRGIPDGTYRLLADKPGYARGRSEAPFTVAAAPLSGLLLELDRGAIVSGRILGLDFDELARVQIAAHGPRDLGARRGRTDYEGRYTIAGFTPGRWKIFAEVRATGRRAEATALVEAGVREMTVDLEFRDGLSLTGRALQGGVPVQGASVRLSRGSARSGSAVTGPDGAFTIAGLDGGTYQLRLFQIETGLRHEEEIEVFADREVVIEVADGWIAGHLRDARDGRPIAGGRLNLEPAAGSPAGRARGSRTVSDSRGYFRLDGVPPGSWRLTASKSGYSPAETPVEVPAGGGAGGFELELEPAADLTFEVVLDSGRVPAAVRLAVFDSAGRVATSGRFETAEGGRVRLDRVPAGRWNLALAAEDSANLYLPVTAPGSLGPLRLPPAGRLDVLVPPLAREEASAQILLTGPDGQPFRTWGSGRIYDRHPIVHGRFLAGRLSPGIWQVTVVAGDGRTWSGSAEVRAATTARLLLR